MTWFRRTRKPPPPVTHWVEALHVPLMRPEWLEPGWAKSDGEPPGQLYCAECGKAWPCPTLITFHRYGS